MTAAIPITIRDHNSADEAFVFATWLNSQRTAPGNAEQRDRVYYARQHQRIARLLQRSKVLVACNPDDTSHLYGYCCWEATNPPVLHFVYVKGPFQRMGIGGEMVSAALPGLGARVTVIDAMPRWLNVAALPGWDLAAKAKARERMDRWQMVYDPEAGR